MADKTNISWTDKTFNPWRGCLKVSEACKFCYADAMSKRNPKMLGVFGTEAQGGTRIVASEDMWRKPPKWNTQGSSRVFCASLADVFEDWSGPILNHKGLEMAVCHGCGKVDTAMDCIDCGGSHDLCSRIPRRLTMADVRRRLFDLIDETPNLTWQLLTKRPENIRSMWYPKRHYSDQYPDDPYPNAIAVTGTAGMAYHRPNTWLGTTVENQEMADKRIPDLLKCSDLSPVTFLSMEPLLGPVDLEWPDTINPARMCCSAFDCGCQGLPTDPPLLNYIQWVIVGCESGPNRRETKLEWVRSLRDQCKRWHVPIFIKQLEIDGKVTTDISKFPENLQIQEFPK